LVEFYGEVPSKGFLEWGTNAPATNSRARTDLQLPSEILALIQRFVGHPKSLLLLSQSCQQLHGIFLRHEAHLLCETMASWWSRDGMDLKLSYMRMLRSASPQTVKVQHRLRQANPKSIASYLHSPESPLRPGSTQLSQPGVYFCSTRTFIEAVHIKQTPWILRTTRINEAPVQLSNLTDLNTMTPVPRDLQMQNLVRSVSSHPSHPLVALASIDGTVALWYIYESQVRSPLSSTLFRKWQMQCICTLRYVCAILKSR
jgi:hypothetical protein